MKRLKLIDVMPSSISRDKKVQADSVYFADNRRSEGNNTAAPQYAAESAAGGFAEVSEDDGELPF